MRAKITAAVALALALVAAVVGAQQISLPIAPSSFEPNCTALVCGANSIGVVTGDFVCMNTACSSYLLQNGSYLDIAAAYPRFMATGTSGYGWLAWYGAVDFQSDAALGNSVAVDKTVVSSTVRHHDIAVAGVGKASCWKWCNAAVHSQGMCAGYCSTQPDGSGNCTCN